jgi:hypothetical protein
MISADAAPIALAVIAKIEKAVTTFMVGSSGRPAHFEPCGRGDRGGDRQTELDYKQSIISTQEIRSPLFPAGEFLATTRRVTSLFRLPSLPLRASSSR